MLLKKSLQRLSTRSKPITNSPEHSPISTLASGVDGMVIHKESRTCSVHKEGRSSVFIAGNSKNMDEMLDGTYGSLKILDQLYIKRERHGSQFFYRDLDDTHKESFASLTQAIEGFAQVVSESGGISLLGSHDSILQMQLIKLLEGLIVTPACHLYKQDDFYYITTSESSSAGEAVVLKTKQQEVAVSFLNASAYDVIFVEDAIGSMNYNIPVALATMGKNIILCSSHTCAANAVYGFSKMIGAEKFTSVFKAAFFAASLTNLFNRSISRTKFRSIDGFDSWSVLNSSPNPDEFVLSEKNTDMSKIGSGNIYVFDLIQCSRDTGKIIQACNNALDLANSLRLKIGWKSMADNAMNYARGLHVSFEQVRKKIPLI